MISSPIYIFESNTTSAEVLKSYLSEIIDTNLINVFTDIETGLKELKLKKTNNDSIVIIDVSQKNFDFKQTLNFIKKFTNKIVATSLDYNTNTIIKALKNGAKDILAKPIIKEDLIKSIKCLSEENKNNQCLSKVLTVFSNKGGIGKTTIATNLAIELAKTTQEKVLLLDLNLQLGDISTFLNINPIFDVSNFIKSKLDKSESEIINSMEKYKENLYILADPKYIEQAENIKGPQIEKLLNKLKTLFSIIVIDISSNIDEVTLKTLDMSDWILFTSIINIPAIRNAQRCLNLFKARNYPKDKIKIIINRYIENNDFSMNDIKNTLQEEIYWTIPNNYFTIMEAINRGIGVTEVNINSNIGNNFMDLANKISEDIINMDINYKYNIGVDNQ